MFKLNKKYIPQFEPVVKVWYALSVFRQMLSGWVGPGKTVKRFEALLSKYIYGNETGFVACTNSGTSALLAAITALDLPKNSSIVFPDYTFIAGANAIQHLGFNVKLVDIRQETLCINPDILEQELIRDVNKKISAVIFVNHNGYFGDDVFRIRNICNRYNIPMIEDAACALGVKSDTQHAGTVGDIGILSFSVPKILTTGQGGAIITNKLCYYNRSKEFIDQGALDWRQTQLHPRLGVNLKFNDILASYGISQLKNIDKLLLRRKKILMLYKKYLNHPKILFFEKQLYPESPWMIVIDCSLLSRVGSSAHEIQRRLHRAKFGSKLYYKPVHVNTRFYQKEFANFVVADWAAKSLLYLPSSLSLRERDIRKICTIINEYL